MFNQFNLKQKIVMGMIIAVIVIAIGVYGFFSMQKQNTVLNLNEMLVEENREEVNQEIDEVKEKEEVGNIVVHITGAVKNKGILRLPEGSRISDAIEAAGGETKEADLDSINLAYVLEDGQKIYIPSQEDKENNEQKQYITTESGDTTNIKENSKIEGENEKVNINTANQSELETLPGIGPSLASRIIEYREQNGKFNSIEELKNVKGIGDAKFEDLKNSATI